MMSRPETGRSKNRWTAPGTSVHENTVDVSTFLAWSPGAVKRAAGSMVTMTGEVALGTTHVDTSIPAFLVASTRIAKPSGVTGTTYENAVAPTEPSFVKGMRS